MNTRLMGAKRLLDQVKTLSYTSAQKRQVHKKMARQVLKYSRQHIRAQRSIDGTPWAPRKAQARRKMLRGLSRTMIAFGTDDHGMVTYKNSLTGRIAG